jgi:hypothetical protein
MKQITVTFTYSKVTPESAEHGDYSDQGIYMPGGWEYSENDPEIFEDMRKNRKDYEVTDDLESIAHTCQGLGICADNDNGESFYSYEEVTDYSTGEDTTYGVHFSRDESPETIQQFKKLLS